MNDKTQLKRASKLGVIFYSCGDLASQFVWTFIGSYLTIFYTPSALYFEDYHVSLLPQS